MSTPAARTRFSPDLIVSGAAIFISLCTLAVLLYEAKVMREQQRAAVWPYVEIGAGFGAQGFHIMTSNQGIGPARIQAMQVRVDGEPVSTWTAMFQALGVSDSTWSQDKTNGRVLPGQSTLPSLQAPGGDRARAVYAAYLEDERIALSLCYCSVYDDCWRVEVQGLHEERERVDACEIDAATEFEL
jgi:hypothetical protein